MIKQEGFAGQRSVIIPKIILDEISILPACQQLHITDIGFYPKAEHHQRIRKKGSKQYILIYCILGSGWLSINGVRKSVNQNQYFVIPKNQPHSYGSSLKTPWSIYWVHFSGNLANEFTDNQNHIKSIPNTKEARITDRIKLFEEILQNLEMGFNKENLIYANICMLHFLASIKYIDQFRQVKNIKVTDKVESAVLYMRENLNKELSLKSISGKIGLSPSHFSLIFRERTGRSPMDYFIKLKIQAACQYLDHTNMKIKNIANKVGIEDPYYFSRIFKRTMGDSPLQYRKKLKG
ncbi:AraC family transcriptional regulator [Flavivirga algicola]|uniref:AraC family transcriptional regulator n=1 Tax=Flavivirga algicola TaxID=2729136 RepID=A0ABX1RXC3_9FLAO|nr:AraC family transcriptional regulator [Flavivirga algicola]NMH86854.1 AraC family transcriptional regulator [Flavivirga algicola]